MYSYIKGFVTEIGTNNIVVEASGIGFLIYVPNPFCYEEIKNIKFMYIIRLVKMSIVCMVLKKRMNLNFS